MWFFVDAETDGLYGAFLSVAAIVTDEKGEELDRFYGAVRVTQEDISTPWVRENVFPSLARAETFYETEHALLESFWQFWLRYREQAACVTHVPYPVESRLFLSCVTKDPREREFLAPFPMYDLATLLRSKGLDFHGELPLLSGMELKPHDAMNDVRMMAALWRKLL